MKTVQAKSLPLATPIAYKAPDGKVYQANVKKIRGTSLFDLLYLVSGKTTQGIELQPTDKVTFGNIDEEKIDGSEATCTRHGHRILFANSTACKGCQKESADRIRKQKKTGEYVPRKMRVTDPLTGDLTTEAQERIAQMIAAAKAAENRTREELIGVQLRNIANGQGPRNGSKAKVLAYNSASFTSKCAEFGITVAQGIDLAGADAEHMSELSWADYRKAYPKKQTVEAAA